MLTPSSNWFASFDNVSSSLVQHLLELVQWWNELNMGNSQIDINQEKWLFEFIRPKNKIWASKTLRFSWFLDQKFYWWHFRSHKLFLNRWVFCIFWTHDSFFDDFKRLFQAESNFFETSIFEILNHFSTILFKNRFFLFLTQIWCIWICSSWYFSKGLSNINAEIWWNIGWIFMRYKDL